MKNVKAYVRTTLTAGLILAAAVLGGCSKSDAGSSAADTAAASSGTESAASADASNSNTKELKYGKAAGPYTVLFEDAIKPILEKEGYTLQLRQPHRPQARRTDQKKRHAVPGVPL